MNMRVYVYLCMYVCMYVRVYIYISYAYISGVLISPWSPFNLLLISVKPFRSNYSMHYLSFCIQYRPISTNSLLQQLRNGTNLLNVKTHFTVLPELNIFPLYLI